MNIIVGHTHMDFDCLASMVAAKLLYPEFEIILPNNIERMVKRYLDNEGIPVEYTYSTELKENIDKLIMVDNDDLERTGIDKKLIKDADVLKIFDHHDNPDESWIEKDTEVIHKPYGANITLLLEIIFDKQIEFDSSFIKIFLLGIYEDTGFLTYISITKNDVDIFNRLFQLLEEPDLSFINKYLLTDFNKEQLSIMDDLADSAEIIETNGNTIAYCMTERDEFVDNLAIVVQRLMIILSVDIIFTIVRLDKNIYFWSRSNVKDVHVKKIAEDLGGGGHPSAGYALIKDKTFVEIREKVYGLIDKYFITGKRAEDIMTGEIIYTTEDSIVKDVKEKMVAHNHNRLPVVDYENKLIGVISKKEIDKLVNHDLKDTPIYNYINFSIPTVKPGRSINHIKQIFLKEKFPMIIVINDGGTVIGVITLEDVLENEFPEEQYKSGKKNYKKKLEYNLPKDLYNIIVKLGEIADYLNYKAYIVGGMVRDLLLERENYDLDIVIEGDGLKYAKKVKEIFDVEIDLHKKFKTAVLFFDDYKVDIATARSETYKSPGALPDVISSSLKYDLYRRDFTINAMAISISEDDFGDLIDFFNSYNDLKNELIKIMHNISFIEDPTRILRAVRFAARFDFEFDRQTKKLIEDAIDLNMLDKISGRRIKDEIKLIFKEDYPEKCFLLMDEMDIFEGIISNTHFTKEKEKLFREIRHVLHWYDHLYLNEEINTIYLYFLALLYDLKMVKIENYGDKFELTKQFKIISQEVKTFIRKKYQVVKRNDSLKKSKVYDLFKGLKFESILFLTAFYREDEKFQRYSSIYLIDIYPKEPLLNGKDLKKMGIKNGLRIKKILNDLKIQHINDKIETKKGAKKYIKKYYLD